MKEYGLDENSFLDSSFYDSSWLLRHANPTISESRYLKNNDHDVLHVYIRVHFTFSFLPQIYK